MYELPRRVQSQIRPGEAQVAVFTLEDVLSVQTHNASMAVFILRMHYPTGRT